MSADLPQCPLPDPKRSVWSSGPNSKTQAPSQVRESRLRGGRPVPNRSSCRLLYGRRSEPSPNPQKRNEQAKREPIEDSCLRTEGHCIAYSEKEVSHQTAH